MDVVVHWCKDQKVVEISSGDVLVTTEQEALDLMVNVEYQYNTKKMIVRAENMKREFFDLRTGFAGAVLQKVSNYNFQLAIIGDFSNVSSSALRDFIRESNKNGQVLFLSDVSTAVDSMCR